MWRTVLASPELSDAGTVTAGPSVASMAPANLQKQQPRDRLRLTDRTQAYFQYDLTAAMLSTGITSWDLVAPLYINAYDNTDAPVALDTATFTITAANTVGGIESPSWTSPAVAVWLSPGLSHRPSINSFHLESSARTEKVVRVTFSLPSNVSYLDVGRGYVGISCQPTAGIAIKPRHGPMEEERRHRTFRGSTIPRAMPQSWPVELVLQERAPGALEAVYGGLFKLYRKRGAAKDVLCILDADNTTTVGDMIVMGLFSQLGLHDLPDIGHGSLPIRIEELV